MRLAALFSGGKDSVMAVHEAVGQGHEIYCLVTMLPPSAESYMFHHPNAEWTKMQGECMGVPVIQKPTSGVKERELDDMKAALAGLDVDGVVSGALESSYQKKRVDAVAGELELESLSPLWHKAGRKLFEKMLGLGLEIIVVGAAAEGLGEEWLGKRVDETALDELEKTQVHIMFEGGEAETFVLDAPMFQKRLEVTDAEKSWDGVRGEYAIKEMRAVPKG